MEEKIKPWNEWTFLGFGWYSTWNLGRRCYASWTSSRSLRPIIFEPVESFRWANAIPSESYSSSSIPHDSDTFWCWHSRAKQRIQSLLWLILWMYVRTGAWLGKRTRKSWEDESGHKTSYFKVQRSRVWRDVWFLRKTVLPSHVLANKQRFQGQFWSRQKLFLDGPAPVNQLLSHLSTWHSTRLLAMKPVALQ